MSVKSADSREPIGFKPIALDGGYGWVVVLGSFLIHVFADGFVYSFGVIAEPVLKQLDTSRAGISTVLALLTGLMMGVGPVASAICNRFGCRVTTIMGAIIASIGCLISSFVNSIVLLVLTCGVIMGIGFGMMYCPAIVIVTMYFEKYRSLATGITVCGAGVGTLVFPKIFAFLLTSFDEEIAWRRVFQIYSAIVLLCVPCAALFKPVNFQPIYDEEESDDEDKGSDVLLTREEDETMGAKKSLIENNSYSNDNLNCEPGIVDTNNAETKPLLGANMQLPKTLGPFSQRTCCPSSSSSMSRKRLLQSESNLVELGQAPKKTDSKSKVNVSVGYVNVTDCFFPRSVIHLPPYNEDPQKFRSVSGTAVLSTISKLNADKKKLCQIAENEKEVVEEDSLTKSLAKEPTESTNIWKTIKKMMDLSLFMEPVFVIFAISNFFMSIGFDPPPMFMPMYALRKKWCQSQATTTVSIYGLASIFGRVTFGLVCDCELPFSWGKDRARNRMWIFSVSMILCGLSCCLVFWMETFWLFGVYCFFFAFTISSFVCLVSVVLVDLVGVDRLTNAFGLLLFIQGVATFIGPPVAGRLYDVTCHYYWSFAFCGICLLLGGALLIVILLVQHLLKKRATEQEESIRKLEETQRDAC